jgi:hypothetical protein
MKLVKKRALEYKSKGFTAQKWFFRYGPAKGTDGLKTNDAQPTSKKHIQKTNGYRKKYNLPLSDNSS